MRGPDTISAYTMWTKDLSVSEDLRMRNKDMLIIGLFEDASEFENDAAFNAAVHFYSPKPPNLDVIRTIIQLKRSSNSLEHAVSMLRGRLGIVEYNRLPGLTTSKYDAIAKPRMADTVDIKSVNVRTWRWTVRASTSVRAESVSTGNEPLPPPTIAPPRESPLKSRVWKVLELLPNPFTKVKR
jgi:hypothetical protein